MGRLAARRMQAGSAPESLTPLICGTGIPRPRSPMIRPVETRDLDTIAMIESRLFATPAGPGDLEKLLARPASRGFVFEDADGRGDKLCAVHECWQPVPTWCRSAPTRRRSGQGTGIASADLSAAADLADEGVEEVILEVAVDNDRRAGALRPVRFHRGGAPCRLLPALERHCRCDCDAPKSRAGFGLTRTGARHRNRPQDEFPTRELPRS